MPARKHVSRHPQLRECMRARTNADTHARTHEAYGEEQNPVEKVQKKFDNLISSGIRQNSASASASAAAAAAAAAAAPASPMPSYDVYDLC